MTQMTENDKNDWKLQIMTQKLPKIDLKMTKVDLKMTKIDND